jgi:hypothetical protein
VITAARRASFLSTRHRSGSNSYIHITRQTGIVTGA